MAVEPSEQTALDERAIENDEMEAALEARDRLRVAAGEARRDYSEADQRARAMLAEFDLNDGDVLRIGRFRVTRSHVAPRSVAFETAATSRVTIAPVGDDDDA